MKSATLAFKKKRGEAQRRGRVNDGEDSTAEEAGQEHSGVAVDEGEEAEDGVEDADAEEVPEGAEVSDAVFGIADLHRDGNQPQAFPGGERN